MFTLANSTHMIAGALKLFEIALAHLHGLDDRRPDWPIKSAVAIENVKEAGEGLAKTLWMIEGSDVDRPADLAGATGDDRYRGALYSLPLFVMAARVAKEAPDAKVTRAGTALDWCLYYCEDVAGSLRQWLEDYSPKEASTPA